MFQPHPAKWRCVKHGDQLQWLSAFETDFSWAFEPEISQGLKRSSAGQPKNLNPMLTRVPFAINQWHQAPTSFCTGTGSQRLDVFGKFVSFIFVVGGGSWMNLCFFGKEFVRLSSKVLHCLLSVPRFVISINRLGISWGFPGPLVSLNQMKDRIENLRSTSPKS